MFVKFWCLITLVLAALLMGTSFAHVLEMPSKLAYDGPQWLRVQQHLYTAYARVGGAIELAAMLAGVILGVVLRDWRPSMLLAFAGTACLAGALLVWLVITRRVNSRVAAWTEEVLPSDWQQWRRRWELSHVARFVLQLAGFALLVQATLVSPLSED